MRTILDTSAYSAFKRGHQGVLEAVRRAEQIVLPATVLGESLPQVSVLPLDPHAG